MSLTCSCVPMHIGGIIPVITRDLTTKDNAMNEIPLHFISFQSYSSYLKILSIRMSGSCSLSYSIRHPHQVCLLAIGVNIALKQYVINYFGP